MHTNEVGLYAVCAQIGHPVLGSYMSPVNDAYQKPGLLSCEHRTAMCQLAAADSDLIMVDTWEAEQPSAQRSLVVLQRIQNTVQRHYRQNVRSSVYLLQRHLCTWAVICGSHL